ncbi:RelA/SpoT domain-containing protein [Methylobacterium sp. SD21]|uniref:RelA/SpoT domain-containing protein n=1 Tax=Methylobacterium litchii TaxID=3138810 RepID=UPI00313AD25C
MADLPTERLDRAEVRWAGKQLAKRKLLWSDEAAPEIRHIFHVANAWRDAHNFPMVRIRAQTIGQLNRMQLRGRLTAARLKRLPSIRKKLEKRYLDVIQDLAGVRVILPTLRDVERLAEACRLGLPHEIYNTDDYIAVPRPSGYRSLHLMLKYKAANRFEEVVEGCRVELQLRTRRQHGWATAVEAVGLFRGEALKSGQGDPDWLRLFLLMASETARIEGRPEVPGAPDHADRVRELRDLNARLKAASFLDGISQAVDYTKRYVRAPGSEVYLIRFDMQTHEVSLVGYSSSAAGSRAYHAMERDGDQFDAVLVTTDSVNNLVQAFPNYFGDTRMFAKTLRQVIKGRDVPEFVLPDQEMVRAAPRAPADMSWLRRATRSRSI